MTSDMLSIIKRNEQEILALPQHIPKFQERLDQVNGNVIIFLKLLPSARKQFLRFRDADFICEFFGFIRFTLRPGEAKKYLCDSTTTLTINNLPIPVAKIVVEYADMWRDATAIWFFTLSENIQRNIMNKYTKDCL